MHDRTITRFLVVLFFTAFLITITSHNLVNRDLKDKAKKESTLLSVPNPRIREPAKGGLPPIPDFVEKLTIEHHKKEIKAKIDQTRSYPYPYEAISPQSKVLLKPTFGSHRPKKNAVFAFAEGYSLDVYVTFVESLKLTGFDGDVVFAVSAESEMKRGVSDYLKSYSDTNSDKLRVIYYALTWECYKKNGERILPTYGEGMRSVTNNGFSDCQINGIYSERDGVSQAKDPREARPVATARYEIYWRWSLAYEADSRLLILDVRDSYFQSNPFEFLQSTASEDSCSLDLFEENREAIDIGKSTYNSKWVKSAYGNDIFQTIRHKPVICSGSTMGTKTAVEIYTMAMVAQFDKSKCKQVGCDQGFHNFLYYDRDTGLKDALLKSGCKINVHKQGEGEINNLAAMRNTSLMNQGVLVGGKNEFIDGYAVINNDNITISPVLHQFDRDAQLKVIVGKRTKLLRKKWLQSHASGD